jgi:hypothetical protein
LFEKARQTASAKGNDSLVKHASVRKVSPPYLGVRYFDQEESLDDLDRLLGAGFGIDTVEETATALQYLVQRARDNGMSSKGAETLNQLVREFRDIWAIKLGPGAPADVPPMRVQLKPYSMHRLHACRDGRNDCGARSPDVAGLAHNVYTLLYPAGCLGCAGGGGRCLAVKYSLSPWMLMSTCLARTDAPMSVRGNDGTTVASGT